MLLKGKPCADKIIENIKNLNLTLKLTVFHPVGDVAAESYLKAKKKWLSKVGFEIDVVDIDSSTTKENFYSLLEEKNRDASVTSIMIELPLPFKADMAELKKRISPLKDVDAVTYENQGIYISEKNEKLIPCTAMGAVKLLEHYDIDIQGKNVVVIGRSAIVGLPLFKLLLNRNATVTVAHSRTANLKDVVAKSDIVCLAVGSHGVIDSSWVKDGATVVDIGINSDSEGNLCGDMKIIGEDESDRINYSPVPGGSGIVTNGILLMNMVNCYELQRRS